jgi:hypothetical protein
MRKIKRYVVSLRYGVKIIQKVFHNIDSLVSTKN